MSEDIYTKNKTKKTETIWWKLTTPTKAIKAKSISQTMTKVTPNVSAASVNVMGHSRRLKIKKRTLRPDYKQDLLKVEGATQVSRKGWTVDENTPGGWWFNTVNVLDATEPNTSNGYSGEFYVMCFTTIKKKEKDGQKHYKQMQPKRNQGS